MIVILYIDCGHPRFVTRGGDEAEVFVSLSAAQEYASDNIEAESVMFIDCKEGVVRAAKGRVAK